MTARFAGTEIRLTLDAGLPLETAIITLIHELKHSEQRYMKRRQVKVASDTGVLTPHWLGVAYDIDETELPEDEYLALPWEIEARAAELAGTSGDRCLSCGSRLTFNRIDGKL
jgi:hypothetical protein